jgi:hypothetical protein
MPSGRWSSSRRAFHLRPRRRKEETDPYVRSPTALSVPKITLEDSSVSVAETAGLT